MADPIQLLNAARAHKDLAHQIAAWRWLQGRIPADALAEFAELFRADPPAKEPSPPPRADWLSYCLPLVREFEGCHLVAYPDPGTGGDPWTIGWGHTGPEVKQGVTWTQQQADAALITDLHEAYAGMRRALPMAIGYLPNQQAALTSWVFNVGAGAAADSTLRRRLSTGEDPTTVVREELPRWNKGGNGVLEGLVRRRSAEVNLFTKGAQQQQSGRVRACDPFATRLTPHITLGEFALQREERRFDHDYQVQTAAELAAFLERGRAVFGGKPVIITSGYRNSAVNASVGGAKNSEHLYDAPGVGAVDWYIEGVDIYKLQSWCIDNWPYSTGRGAPKGFVHTGIRRGRPKVVWDY